MISAKEKKRLWRGKCCRSDPRKKAVDGGLVAERRVAGINATSKGENKKSSLRLKMTLYLEKGVT